MLAGIPVAKKSFSYADTNVTTAAWVEVIAATEQPFSALEIFSGSGSILKLSSGDAGDEDAHEIPYYIIPGGSSIMLPVGLAKGKRLSIKAVDVTADAGILILNFFG
jgi:hypothetical protein